MRRALLIVALLAGGLVGHGGTASALPVGPLPQCQHRLLILSAMPVEVDPLLKAATLDPTATKRVNGRRFFVGTLRGNNVIIAMTGIGIHNAEQATEDAFATFRCAGGNSAINGVVFSGVAGGDWIGDVTVVHDWDENGGTYPVDEAMYATAEQVAASGSVPLTQEVALGDPACACVNPYLVKPVTLEHVPQIVMGGKGSTADPFGDRRLPCFPGGGDVFGCEPCSQPTTEPPDAAAFLTGIVPFLDPAFFFGYFAAPPAADPGYKAQDMESGAVARVAQAHHTPFIAFRGVSDGQGDPLHLPGFPFQFFAYRQIAADNAAAATLGFLEAWAQA